MDNAVPVFLPLHCFYSPTPSGRTGERERECVEEVEELFRSSGHLTTQGVDDVSVSESQSFAELQ